jgi:alpha-aminoadipic semialdehyde synthase
MVNSIGIRHENKYPDERRAPLTPKQVQTLIEQYNIEIIAEPSKNRVFTEREYKQVGAKISSDLSDCNIILGVKEIPPDDFLANHNYLFFSHTIGGHSSNMPMLKQALDLNTTILDYELIKTDKGRRIVFFGRYAGFAGMIDSLWAMGQRLLWEGIDNPFKEIRQACGYENLDEAQAMIKRIGKQIQREGLPNQLVPFICAFTGQGNVSKGAQKIFNLLPIVKMHPDELYGFFTKGKYSNGVLYSIEFRQNHLFEPKDAEQPFDWYRLHRHPDRFINRFEKFVPYLTMIVNGINWDTRFPRLVTKRYLKSLYQFNPNPRLRVIGDITCDVEGSIEATVRTTDSSNPVYVYNPFTEDIADGCAGIGPVIMAIDILPSELPRDASKGFGNALLPFIPALAKADYNVAYEELNLPPELHKAMIVHRGELTERYKHLESRVELRDKPTGSD